MQLGMIGLGRMGGNIVRRLLRAGHRCVVYDADAKAVAALVAEVVLTFMFLIIILGATDTRAPQGFELRGN